MSTAETSSRPKRRKFGEKSVEPCTVELYTAMTNGRKSTHFFCLMSTTLTIIECKQRYHLSMLPLVKGEYAVVRRR